MTTKKTNLEGFTMVGPMEPINLTPEQASWPVKVSESPERFVLATETSPITPEPIRAASTFDATDGRILESRLAGVSVADIAAELNLPGEIVANRVERAKRWFRQLSAASAAG